MRKSRIILVNGVLGVFIAGSAWDVLRDTEHWPWSNYPMYSDLETNFNFNDYRLYGLPRDNPSAEISLYTDGRYLQPFDPSVMSRALMANADKPDIRNGLLDCLVRYESLRLSHRHAGPALVGLRLYKVYWTVDERGQSVEHPNRKQLLQEVTLSPASNPAGVRP